MGKQKGLRWKKFTGTKLNRDTVGEALLTAGAAVVFDLLCGMLFLWSSKSLLSEFYGSMKYSSGFFLRALGLFFVVSVLMEIAGHLRKLPAALLRFGVLLCGSFLTIRWAGKEEVLEKLSSGLWNVAYVYLEQWNKYFESNWYCPFGKEENLTFFLEAVLLVYGAFFLWVAREVKKNSVMAILPVLIMVAELLVGISPSGRGLFLLFAGMLLSCNQSFSVTDFRPSEGKRGNYAGKLKGFGWVPSAVVITVICFVVFIVGRVSAEKVVTEYAGEAEDLILDTANRVANWEFWRKMDDPGGVEKMIESVLGTEDYNYETLDNRTPLYEDVPYLRVTMEQLPANRIYLKGFYADTYVDGIWERTLENFEEGCNEAEFRAATVAEELAVLGVEKLKDRYNVLRLSAHSTGVDVSVLYYEPDTVKAYLPYFSETVMEGISVEGEGNLKKRLSEEEIFCTMWQYAESYDTRLRSFAQAKKPFDWESWYADYVVAQYLTVPENMPNVKKIAAELAAEDITRTKLGSIDSENEKRLAKAFLVADWLGRNTTYSLVLPKLPWGEEPIEYFLGTSRMGYCMHYASAAVMILREMGVPARYASGYVVSKSAFEESPEGYVADILDNQAHAWAEIYLEEVGWVPVEVTAGYSALLPTPTPTPAPTNTPTPTPTPTNTPTPTPVPEPTMKPTGTSGEGMLTETPAATPGAGMSPVPTNGAGNPMTTPIIVPAATSTPTPTPTPSPTPIPGKLGNEVNTSGIEEVKGGATPLPTPEIPLPEVGDTDWGKLFGKSLLILILVIVIALVVLSPANVVDRFFRFEKAYHRRMLWEMKRKGNARAIKMVNRSIYRKLCFSGIIKKGCTDKEYEEALKSNFSVVWPKDWDRYMDIVKAAEFSLRDFTEEEVEFCYKIYRDVIY